MGIPKHWNQEILKKIFEEGTGGKIDKFELWRHDYGVSACLNFSSSDAAKAAVEKLNGKDVASFGIPEPDNTDNELLKEEEKKKISSILPTKLYVARAQKRKERKEYLLRQFSLRPGRRESFRYYELYQYSRQTMPDYVESERSSIETIGKRQHFR